MCEIMDKLMAESKARGHKEGHKAGEACGIIETLEEFEVPQEQIIEKLITKLKITMEEALDYLAVGNADSNVE